MTTADDATGRPPREAAPRPGGTEPDGVPEEALEPGGAEPDEAPEPPHPPRPTGWHALRVALRPRATRAQLLAGVLCAVLGFALVVQLRQNDSSNLADLREDDLVRLLDESTTRLEQLNQEAADLEAEREQLLTSSDSTQVALEAARRNAITQGILSGRLPAEGPGVEVVLRDPDGVIRPLTMLNMLEELRNAGAEAIQLNDLRVTASSSFTGAAGAVQLDGVLLETPYRWVVIGEPDTIATALEIPGGAMAYVRNDGGTGDVTASEHVEVTALRSVDDPKFATPAPGAGS
jgi:uncharacterized protein YlxW (UPF0749 family)